jgi:hypothetical protein
MRIAIIFLWGASLQVVDSAINLDGTQAIAPATENDPSPISGPDSYQPDQHDCPLVCSDFANMHSWIPYFSVNCLRRCREPMLLQFSVTQALEDYTSTILIRGCSLEYQSAVSSTDVAPMENPKRLRDLFQSGLESEPACTFKGTQFQKNAGAGCI